MGHIKNLNGVSPQGKVLGAGEDTNHDRETKPQQSEEQVIADVRITLIYVFRSFK
jgi:hypothetical protein